MVMSAQRYQKSTPIQVLISSSQTGVTPRFSGVVKFDRRLDDIIAMKVNYIAYSQTAPSTFNPLFGNIKILQSSVLGSLLNTNQFQVAFSSNSDNQQMFAQSNIIGWSAPAYTEANISSQVSQTDVNRVLYFSRPYSIETFDWQFQGLRGDIVPTADHCVEIVIEFYHVNDL